MIEAGTPVIAADIVKEAQVRYPSQFADETNRLAFNAATREVKDVLRILTDDDEAPQLTLPGLSLPSVIAIPVEGDYVYRATSACNWPELQAGRTLRADHVAAAVTKLDAYDENLDLLRPIMEGTNLTVAQAARKLAGS
jgi:hypothetical protein